MDLDITLKIGIGLGAACAGAAAIVLPNKRQKDAAALDLYERPYKELTPQEAKVAEFRAGHKRWRDFFEHTVYPVTRKLPGANNPIVNPYREATGGASRLRQQEDE